MARCGGGVARAGWRGTVTGKAGTAPRTTRLAGAPLLVSEDTAGCGGAGAIRCLWLGPGAAGLRSTRGGRHQVDTCRDGSRAARTGTPGATEFRGTRRARRVGATRRGRARATAARRRRAAQNGVAVVHQQTRTIRRARRARATRFPAVRRAVHATDLGGLPRVHAPAVVTPAGAGRPTAVRRSAEPRRAARAQAAGARRSARARRIRLPARGASAASARARDAAGHEPTRATDTSGRSAARRHGNIERERGIARRGLGAVLAAAAGERQRAREHHQQPTGTTGMHRASICQDDDTNTPKAMTGFATRGRTHRHRCRCKPPFAETPTARGS
jgi:hypothetical protein